MVALQQSTTQSCKIPLSTQNSKTGAGYFGGSISDSVSQSLLTNGEGEDQQDRGGYDNFTTHQRPSSFDFTDGLSMDLNVLSHV